MGTHPIFESDFDCLTESRPKIRIMQIRFNEAIVNVETTDELLNMVPSGEVLSAPIQAGFTLEQVGIAPNSTISTQTGLLGGKVHGSLARAGKVKGQTPKVDAEEKRRLKPAVPRDVCNTTDDSSTLFQHSARRRDQTPTHNYDLKFC